MKDGSEPARARGRPARTDSRTTRERLLRAAAALFADGGFEGVGVGAIAREAGLSRAALYAHFSSKRALYDALPGRHEALALRPIVDRLGASEASAERALDAFVVELFAAWSTDDARRNVSLLTRELAAGADAREGLLPGVAETADLLAPHLERWRAQGRIVSPTPGRRLAWSFFTPLVFLRVAYLQSRATTTDITIARTTARRHARDFADNLAPRLTRV